MNKKYKLLRDLPDCKAGAIYHQTSDSREYVCYTNIEIPGTWSVCYNSKYVENNPDFFEEVKENDWEIQSFLSTSASIGDGYVLEPDGMYWVNGRKGHFGFTGRLLHELLNHPNFVIHSVKRSDGEVFTLGDSCYSSARLAWNPFKIEKFTIVNDTAMYADSCPLENLKKWPVRPRFSTSVPEQSPQPKQKERITVKSMWDLNNVYQPQFLRHGYETSNPVPEEKFPAIKAAIEKAINDE